MQTIIITPNGFLARKCIEVLEQYLAGSMDVLPNLPAALCFVQHSPVLIGGLVVDMVAFKSKDSATLETLLYAVHKRNTHTHVYYLISQRKEATCLAAIRDLHTHFPFNALPVHELGGTTWFDWEAGLTASVIKEELLCQPYYPPLHLSLKP